MAITFKKFGPIMGNAGNQFFQLATMLGFSKKYGCELKMPFWQYSEFFANHPPCHGAPSIDMHIDEPQYHYTPEFWDQYAKDFKTKNIDINGWLQSEKYFEHCKGEVKEMFRFKKEFIDEVKFPFVEKGVFNRETIAISIRRGDYVDNPNYELLPIKYYLLALIDEFPDFRDQYNLLIFSDDFDYCKLHFSCLPNAYFAEGLGAMQQMCLGIECDNFIIANSTFSWWMAYLGEKPSSKVIRPNFLFAGPLKKQNQEKDFWPEHWTRVVDHKIRSIDLTNVTFTIPVKYDSKDRMDNANLSIKMLRHHFHTNIIVGEQGSYRFNYLNDIVRYVHFEDMEHFHRTKMLNDMAGMARTPIVVNWDCDMVIPPLQLIEAAHKIKTRQADMVYPYDGRFARVNRHPWYAETDHKADIMFGKTVFQGMRPHDEKSVGGAIMFDVQAFIAGGMENEFFISYGPEDCERYDRFSMLGYRIDRIKGPIYHFDHINGMDSGSGHPHFIHNRKELEKIRSLDRVSLKRFIETWGWRKKYMPSYYEDIFEESVKSRDIVFHTLSEREIIQPGSSVMDFGCGLGQWGYKLNEWGMSYVGIDFGVPLDKLVIPQEQYLDHDLRKPLEFPFETTKLATLGICAEVAEHLEEEHADQLVETICRYSDKVLFSAACPGQGGVNHLNEQWQSYWAEKFEKHGLYPIMFDIRQKFWDNKDVGVWYRQNMVLYTREKHPMMYKLDVVHPEMYMNLMRHHRIL